MCVAQRVVVERSCFDSEPGTRVVLIVLYLDIEPMVADMYCQNHGMSIHEHCLKQSHHSVNRATKPHTAEEMNKIDVVP